MQRTFVAALDREVFPRLTHLPLPRKFAVAATCPQGFPPSDDDGERGDDFVRSAAGLMDGEEVAALGEAVAHLRAEVVDPALEEQQPAAHHSIPAMGVLRWAAFYAGLQTLDAIDLAAILRKRVSHCNVAAALGHPKRGRGSLEQREVQKVGGDLREASTNCWESFGPAGL
ncbi:unnamed protein product [Symbiodinium sp. KB8]|nr:unnamed protein product [Symbiodinium sp. KB8]